MTNHVDSIIIVCSCFKQLRQLDNQCQPTYYILLFMHSSQVAMTTVMPSCTKSLVQSFSNYRQHFTTLHDLSPASGKTITSRQHCTLHWLPVSQHITFKFVLMAYHSIHGRSPAYFSDVCITSIAFQWIVIVPRRLCVLA